MSSTDLRTPGASAPVTPASALAETVSQLERAAELMSEAMVVLDLELRVVMWSTGAARLLGWSAAEALGRPMRELVRPASTPERLAAMREELVAKGRVEQHVSRVLRDGSTAYLAGVITPIHDAQGETLGFLDVVRDETELVSARNALATSEERFRTVAQTMADGMVILDSSGSPAWWNGAAELLLGGSRAQLEATLHDGDAVLDERGGPADRLALPWWQVLRDEAATAESVVGVRRPAGTPVWMLASAVTFQVPGAARPGVVVTFTDITRLRQQADAVAARERHLTAGLEASADAYWELELTTGLVRRSPRLPELLGYRDEDLASDQRTWLGLAHPDDLPVLRGGLDALLAGTVRQLDVECRLRTRLGSWKWVRMRAKVAERAADGKALRLAGVTHDIDAERARLARLLQQARLEGLEHRVNEIEVVLRRDGSIVHANDRAVTAYGYERDELLARNARDLKAGGGAEAVMAAVSEAAQAGTRFRSQHRRRDGTPFPVEVSPRGFEAGGERYIHCLVRDLSDDHRVDHERRLLASLVNTMQDGVVLTDVDFVVTSWPASAQRFYGYTEAEAVGIHLGRLLDTEYPDGDRLEMRRMLMEGKPVRAVVRQRRRDGVRIDVDSTGDSLCDETGRIVGFFTVNRDITRQKQVEGALRASEERYRSVIAAMAEGVVVQQLDGAIVACNAAAERILGVTADQLYGRASIDLRGRAVRGDGSSFPADLHPAMEALRTGRSVSDVTMGVQRADGRVVWLSMNSEPLRQPGEMPYAVVSTFTDVTERRRQAAELLETNQRLSQLLDGTSDCYWDLDLVSNRVRFSGHASSVLGTDVDKLGSDPEAFWARTDSEGAALGKAAFAEHVAGRLPGIEGQFKFRTDDGRWIWLRARGRAVEHDSRGFPLRLTGRLTDVTNLRRAEDELKDAVSRNENLVTELREALASVKTLSGLIPICMYCHRIRDDAGYWERLEKYITDRSDATLTHGLCPECRAEQFPDPTPDD